jgi:methylation protein MtfA
LLTIWADRLHFHDVYSISGAAVYHRLTLGDTSEIREILGALRGLTGDVVELAAGSGRLTVPMLAAGHTVTAIDLSSTMISLLRDRIDELPGSIRGRARTELGDMTEFRLDRRAAAAVLGTTSITLLDEPGRRRLYASIKANLQPGGHLLVSAPARQWSDGATEIRSSDDVFGSLLVHHRVEAGERKVTIVRIPSTPTGPVDVYTSRVRLLPADQVAAELQQSGFQINRRIPVRTSDTAHPVQLIDAQVSGPGLHPTHSATGSEVPR